MPFSSSIPWVSDADSRGWIIVHLLGLAGAVAGDVLALRAARADPVRTTAALALSVLPILVWSWLLLVILSGGVQIGL